MRPSARKKEKKIENFRFLAARLHWNVFCFFSPRRQKWFPDPEKEKNEQRQDENKFFGVWFSFFSITMSSGLSWQWKLVVASLLSFLLNTSAICRSKLFLAGSLSFPSPICFTCWRDNRHKAEFLTSSSTNVPRSFICLQTCPCVHSDLFPATSDFLPPVTHPGSPLPLPPLRVCTGADCFPFSSCAESWACFNFSSSPSSAPPPPRRPPPLPRLRLARSVCCSRVNKC